MVRGPLGLLEGLVRPRKSSFLFISNMEDITYQLLSSLDFSPRLGLLALGHLLRCSLYFHYFFVAVPILMSPSGLTRGQRFLMIIGGFPWVLGLFRVPRGN